jgi:hypothetical protein
MVAGSGWLRGGLLRAGLRGGRACAAPPKPGSEQTREKETTTKRDQPEEAVSEAAKPTIKASSVQQHAAPGAKTRAEADSGLDDQSLLNLDWYGIQVDSVPEVDSNAMILAAGWAIRHADVDSHICEMGDAHCASSLSAGAETAVQLPVLSSTTHVGGKRPGVHGESSEEEEHPGPRKRSKWKRWSQEEESLLTAAVNKHGTANWRIVAKVTRPKTLGFGKKHSKHTGAHLSC